MKKLSLQKRIILSIIAVCVVPLIIWTAFSATTIRSQMSSLVENSAENTLNQIAMSMENSIQGVRNSTRQLISDSKVVYLLTYEKNEANMVSTIIQQLRPLISKIKIQNANIPSSIQIMHKNKDVFDVYDVLQYRENLESIIADYGLGERDYCVVHQEKSVAKENDFGTEWYMYCVGKMNTNVYCVAEVALSRGPLYAALDLYDPQNGESLLLVDSEGDILYGQDIYNMADVGFDDDVLRVGGVYDRDHEKCVIVSKPLESMDAALVICIGRDRFGMTGQQIKLLVLAAIVSVCGMMVVAEIVRRSVFQRLKRLSDRMDGICERMLGNDSQMYSLDEIDHLEQHFDNMLERMRADFEEEKKYTMKDLANEMKPHFICNVLDMLRIKAEQMHMIDFAMCIVRITQYFRYTIMSTQSETTLMNEIQEAQNYIELVNAMRENEVEYHLSLDEWTELNADETKVPRMILQPLIDNAIRHGLKGKEHPLIMVGVRFREGVLTIDVEDNGEGIKEEDMEKINEALRGGTPISGQHRHIGIRNVAMRLKSPNGEDGNLSYVTTPGSGTIFSVVLHLDSKSK